jgi:pyridoxal biosynthesis lyase PdxS
VEEIGGRGAVDQLRDDDRLDRFPAVEAAAAGAAAPADPAALIKRTAARVNA